MTELGQYTASVLAAYAISFALLGGLIWQSLAANARTKAALTRQEGTDARRGNIGNDKGRAENG